ncbi:hypothetical protein DFJ73DRAFT_369672 [Zopfochytrium polystomum]|nr:hypothetical protein DFJ73DRAFT_369672 [Zopfochytrium polystomum]
MRQFIADSDYGIDDASSIMTVASSLDVDLLALTVVDGNVRYAQGIVAAKQVTMMRPSCHPCRRSPRRLSLLLRSLNYYFFANAKAGGCWPYRTRRMSQGTLALPVCLCQRPNLAAVRRRLDATTNFCVAADGWHAADRVLFRGRGRRARVAHG